MNITIAKRPAKNVMGCTSIPFDINLGDIPFDKFLDRHTNGLREYYATRRQESGFPIVTVVLPEECSNMFDLDCPIEAIRGMQKYAVDNRLVTQTHTLQNLAQAIS